MGELRKIVIGIDPDKAKSGIGVVKVAQGERGQEAAGVECEALAFPELLTRVYEIHRAHQPGRLASQRMRALMEGRALGLGQGGPKIEVWVEAGWLEKKSNHHGLQGHRAEKIARDVGANHQTGRLIIEMLASMGIEAQEARPLIKCWKGSERKITHEEIDRIVGGMPRKRSNQEERDALLIAWERTGLPIRC